MTSKKSTSGDPIAHSPQQGDNQTQSALDSLKSKWASFKEAIIVFGDLFGATKKLAVFMWKHSPFHLSFLILTVVFMAALPFIGSWYASKLLDGIIAAVNSGETSLQPLIGLIGMTIAVRLFRTINSNLNSYFEVNLWFDTGRELGYAVSKKFANLDIEYYEDSDNQDLLNKVAQNYYHRPQAFANQIIYGLDSLISIVSAIAILAFFKPIFILILLATTFPRAIANIIYGRRHYGIWNSKGDVKRNYFRTQGYLQSENSLMELRIFKARNFLLEKMYELFTDFQKEEVRIERKRSFVLLIVDILGVIGYSAVAIITALAVLLAEISVGQFNFYMNTAGNLQNSLATFFRRLSRFYEHGLFVKDIFYLLDLPDKVVDGEIELPHYKQPPIIDFKNVDFAYPGTDRKIIDNLNLQIKSGQHVAIVGENGAGKSTLIKMLMRFYDVTNGEILINGVGLQNVQIDSWYENVGALFQEFNFYHFDAKTNIGVGNVSMLDDFGRIVESAKKSGAHSFIENYENKYDQILDKGFKGGIRPSVGQKQKIALARAFFKDAPILILDEPTSAIDPKAEAEIFDQLFDFAKNKTVIIISHRFSTVRNADRIIVLDGGKIVEDGSHVELMQIDGGRYREAFEIQRKGYV